MPGRRRSRTRPGRRVCSRAVAALSRSERIVLAIVALATALAGIAHYGGGAAGLASAAGPPAPAGIAHYGGWPSGLAFALATLALAGLAHLVGLATEQVGHRYGPSVTGVLQSTLGNLPELFVVIFALQKGETVVAQTSIIGSLFANALLVLGLVIVVGARAAPDGVMRFKSKLPMDTSTLLLVTTFIIVIIGLAHASNDPAAQHVRELSAIGAVALLLVYLAWVVPYLRSDDAQEASEDEAGAAMPLAVAVTLLALGGVGSAFVSDWFVAALRPTIDALGVSDAFAGLVIVAIAGNAVENFAGI